MFLIFIWFSIFIFFFLLLLFDFLDFLLLIFFSIRLMPFQLYWFSLSAADHDFAFIIFFHFCFTLIDAAFVNIFARCRWLFSSHAAGAIVVDFFSLFDFLCFADFRCRALPSFWCCSLSAPLMYCCWLLLDAVKHFVLFFFIFDIFSISSILLRWL